MTHIASRLEFVTLDELEVGFADRLGTEAVFLPRSILGTAQDVLYVGAAVLVDIQTALGEKALSFEGYVAWAYPGAPRTPPGREAGTGIWIERIVDEDSVARAARMRRRPGAGGRVRIPGTRLPALRLPVSPPSAPKKTASTPPMPATLFTPPKTPPPVVMTSSDTGLPVEAEPGPALPLSDVEVDASGEIVVSHPPAPQPRLMAMGLLVDQSFDPTPSPGPPPLELEDRPTDERLDIHMAGILAPPVGTLEGLPIHDAPRAISLEGLPDAPVVVPAAFFEQRQTDVDLLVSLDDADFFPAELEEQRARARRSVRSQEPPALDPAQHTSVAPLQPAPAVGSEHSAVAAAQAVGAERSAAVGAERSAAVGAVAAAQAVGAERSEGAERSAAVGAVNPALAEPTVMSWDQLDDLPPDLPPDLPGDVADERSTDFADAARVAAARALTEAREEADAAARARALAEARAEADAIAHAALEADELRAQAQRAERASLEASARAADAVPLPAAMMAEPFAPRTADVDELAKSAARDVTPELARDLAQNLTSDLARELAEDDLAADDDDLAPEDLSDSDVELLPDVASDEFAILPALRLEGATADTADTTQPRPPSEEPSDLDVVGGVIDPLLDPPEFSVAEQTAIINARPASKRSGEWDGRTEHSNPETAEGASTRTAEATSSDADQSPAEASAVPVPPPRALPAPEGFPPTPEIAPGIMGCAFLVSVKRGGDGVHAIEPFTWPRNGTKRWNALDVAREDGEDLDIAIAQSPWLARDPSAGPPSTFPELGIEPSAFEVGMTDPGVSVADVVGKAVQLAAEDGDDNVFSDMPASVRPAMKRPDDEGDPTMDSTVDEGNAPLASPDDEEIETDRDLKRPPSQASPETRARLGVLQKILGRR